MVSQKHSLALLLTATIDPGATPLVARHDPSVRLRDYEEALTFWLASGSVQKVVLYENSGSDIQSLRSIARSHPQHEVEFHSFAANDCGEFRGKGYPELLSMARTIEASSLLKNCDYVAKCTGRLTAENALSLFRQIELEDFDVMCTLRLNLSFANSRLFVFKKSFFWDYLMPQAEIINDLNGVYFEHALACATARAISERKKWMPFPEFPRIRGISGTSNTSQTFSRSRTALHAVFHRIERYIFSRPG